jgi:aldehyde dehydrogenase (NAD+)
VQVERVLDLLKAGRLEGGEFYSPDGDMPEKGCYVRPTLVTGISPAHTLASEEIFGPVLVAMSFRTPEEAVALANNTRYGLAASIWTENINLALDIAPKIKAGVVWVNSTNQFDAAVGFGGYRESGFGREGGKEGMSAYLKPAWEKKLKAAPVPKLPDSVQAREADGIDRTAKLYIGGKQVRPDSGYAIPVVGADGKHLGEVGEGNRKDIRNAVEAARGALGWASATAHNRSQILYYLGENLDYRKAEFADRIRSMTGVSANAARREVELSIERLFAFGGWADKFDGAVHNPPARMMAVAMVEPVGVLGIAAPAESALLGAVSLLAPAIAMGNTVVLVPSEPHPLAMTDF